jgi:hypothetical protein
LSFIDPGLASQKTILLEKVQFELHFKLLLFMNTLLNPLVSQLIAIEGSSCGSEKWQQGMAERVPENLNRRLLLRDT